MPPCTTLSLLFTDAVSGSTSTFTVPESSDNSPDYLQTLSIVFESSDNSPDYEYVQPLSIVPESLDNGPDYVQPKSDDSEDE